VGVGVQRESPCESGRQIIYVHVVCHLVIARRGLFVVRIIRIIKIALFYQIQHVVEFQCPPLET
jgi:hypothetical protein